MAAWAHAFLLGARRVTATGPVFCQSQYFLGQFLLFLRQMGQDMPHISMSWFNAALEARSPYAFISGQKTANGTQRRTEGAIACAIEEKLSPRHGIRRVRTDPENFRV